MCNRRTQAIFDADQGSAIGASQSQRSHDLVHSVKHPRELSRRRVKEQRPSHVLPKYTLQTSRDSRPEARAFLESAPIQRPFVRRGYRDFGSMGLEPIPAAYILFSSEMMAEQAIEQVA